MNTYHGEWSLVELISIMCQSKLVQLMVNILHNHIILVGGLEHVFYFSILGIIIPIDKLIFFRGIGQPPTISIDYS